ncbi:uncharacterized protein L203_103561 [Cryptococcus depauperatus CBS 7841]|uniref:Uncharacterized protein n=1 Tax=Cryptococcus depauperatus CBS 7841 TaxID=1295531 RepID=A0A1E3II18_9TREE|nr:hypothetical protein L203_02842 [Cryptococcus depauperatus CBS 7841]
MFSSPRFFVSKKVELQSPPEISPLLAAELGLEYASTRAKNNCPKGIYLVPSEETLLKWHGVFFVHRGPYKGSVLRFTLVFPQDYPQSAPTVRFSSDVFHPMIDSKTKIWYPRGRLTQWRPRADHIPQLLYSLKASFKTKLLEGISEEEAVNKHMWSLYHHNHQTFLSMTTQRSMHSASQTTLYPEAYPLPPSPTRATGSPQKKRQTSANSLASDDGLGSIKDMIQFTEITKGQKERLWEALKESLKDE